MTQKPFHVQGHRGACLEVLENTLPSFQRAFEVGADSIELDVHVTKDKKLAVYHDFCLNRFCCRDPKDQMLKKSPPLYSLTLSEIKAHDCVDDHRMREPNKLTKEERQVPSLLEVFDLFKKAPSKRAKEILVDIEIKSDPNQPQFSPAPQVFVKLVCEAVTKYWNWDQTVLRSFDGRILKEIKKEVPTATIAALTPEKFYRYEWVLDEFEPDMIAPDFTALNPSDVRLIHKAGVEVMPYTVNEPKDWERLIQMGIDGITTDDPKSLIEYLKGKKLR